MILDLGNIPKEQRVNWAAWYTSSHPGDWWSEHIEVRVQDGELEDHMCLIDSASYDPPLLIYSSGFKFRLRDGTVEMLVGSDFTAARKANLKRCRPGEVLCLEEGMYRGKPVLKIRRRRWTELDVVMAEPYTPEQWREYIERGKTAELERAKADIERRWGTAKAEIDQRWAAGIG